MSTSNVKWHSIEKSEAEAHPLYGVKGWLLIFIASQWAGVFIFIGRLNQYAYSLGLTFSEALDISDPVANYFSTAILIQLSSALAIIILATVKFRDFRTISMILIAGVPLILIIFTPGQIMTNGVIFKSIPPWITYLVIWGSYLQKSKRVRVTFEDKVISHLYLKNDKGITKSSDELRTNLRSKSVQPNHISEDEVWTAVHNEFESGDVKKGLWARAFAESDGDENRAKAAYLRLRKAQLLKANAGR